MKVLLLILASIASFCSYAKDVNIEPFFIRSSIYQPESYCLEGSEFASKLVYYQLSDVPLYKTRMLATNDAMDQYIINSYKPEMSNILKHLRENSIERNGANWMKPVLHIVESVVYEKCLKFVSKDIPVFG